MRKLIYVLCFMPCALYGQTADFFAPRAVALEPAPDECVGKTDNMACVFDTVIACAVRRDAKLCEKVGLKYDRQFKNTFGVLAGGDYKYNLVELFINRRGGACSVDDARSCVTNPADEKLVRPNVSMRDNNNIGVFLRREKEGGWSVIFAAQFACWPDEECS